VNSHEVLSLLDGVCQPTGRSLVVLFGVSHGDGAGLVAQGSFGAGSGAPGEGGHGSTGAEGLAEDGGASLHVGAGVRVDEDRGIAEGSRLGGATEFPDPLDVVRAEETDVALYVVVIEDRANDADLPAQDLGSAYGQVRRILRVDAAEPDQILSRDGRRFLLVQAEVHGQLGDRLVVGVPLDHVGRVAVEAGLLAVEGRGGVLEDRRVLERGDVAAQLVPGAGPGGQRGLLVPDDQEVVSGAAELPLGNRGWAGQRQGSIARSPLPVPSCLGAERRPNSSICSPRLTATRVPLNAGAVRARRKPPVRSNSPATRCSAGMSHTVSSVAAAASRSPRSTCAAARSAAALPRTDTDCRAGGRDATRSSAR
jgi:hypothetical protein